jgi:hypothetical protein
VCVKWFTFLAKIFDSRDFEHDFAHVPGGTFGDRQPKQFVTFVTLR